MSLLTVIPTQRELEHFVQHCCAHGYETRTYTTGPLTLTVLPDLNLVVAPGGLGKAQFAVQTQYLLAQHPWDMVICAGSAGALIDGLAIGDVVIATETVEHDIHSHFAARLLPRFPAASKAVQQSQSTLQSISTFSVHYGPVASGDEDIVDEKRRTALHVRTGALVAAWEGAGGARACTFVGVPFLEIRGVTDRADGSAAADFRANLAVTMCHVAQVVMALARCSIEASQANLHLL